MSSQQGQKMWGISADQPSCNLNYAQYLALYPGTLLEENKDRYSYY